MCVCAWLFGVGNQEMVPVREVVHRGTRREIGSVLASAMEHDDQRAGYPGAVARRDIQVVVPVPRRTGMPDPATPPRKNPALGRTVGECAAGAAHSNDQDDRPTTTATPSTAAAVTATTGTTVQTSLTILIKGSFSQFRRPPHCLG